MCLNATRPPAEELRRAGLDAIARRRTAVVTLAAGAGQPLDGRRGVVKALHPFCKFGGRHRTFIETHLAQEPPQSANWPAAAAAHFHYQLLDTRGHHGISQP